MKLYDECIIYWGRFYLIKTAKMNISIYMKVSTILLCIAIIYSLLVFNGLIDAFAPKHIVVIEETVRNSYLNMDSRMINQIPGFYAFGAVFKLITNFPSIGLLLYPIQMIPFLVVFYAFIYKLSNSYLFTSIVVLVQLTAGTTGTQRLFLWPHGIGGIVFYTFLLVFALMILNNNHKVAYKIMLIIAGISIIFISYNSYVVIMIFLFVNAAIATINNSKVLKIKNIIQNYNKELIGLLIILIIAQLGLSQFFYQTFVPTIMSDIEITGFDKFMNAYFNKEPVTNQLVISKLLITYPQIITTISLIKYTTILMSIILFLYLLIQKYKINNKINVFDQVTLSFVAVYFFYGLVRLAIGGFPITLLYFPGIICIIWLYRHSNWKNMATFSILIILILNPVYTFSMNEAVPKDNIHNTDYIKQSSNWYFQHKNKDISSVSDELTRNLFQYYIHDKTNNLHTTSIIKSDQISFLLQDPSSQQNQKNYYILNYYSSSMSIQNWRILKSWKYSESVINSNNNISKIYDNNGLSIHT
ncbi:MAG: hypothetical protein RBT65_11755 [Methanolobus sp.]|nr:hypothetical protein [Methanolobus sp.]